MEIYNRSGTQAGQTVALRRLPVRYERGQGSNRPIQRASVAKLIIADVLIAALLLTIFALYYFLLPRDLSHNARQLTRLESNREQAAEMPHGTFSGADMQAVRPTAGQASWAEKFAGKFTDGTVIKTDNTYKSANISVNIDKVLRDDVTYYVADIYVADLKYFRTAFAKGTFGSGIHDATNTIAAENDAILAINGDYSGNNAGPVVRNGVLYREEVYKDALVMYTDGSMETFTAKELNMDSQTEKGVWQVWTFGPMLLRDGQTMETFNSTLNPKNPRTAIGYYEPGHYCFVVVDGRQPGYSAGYTLKEMSQLFYEMGCAAAFNLDGGQSSEMSFMGEFVNKPYNGGRGTSDIVYITDK